MISINLMGCVTCLIISLAAHIRGDNILGDHYLILMMVWLVLFKLDNMRK